MHLGQYRARAIPLWCSFLLFCCIHVGISGCSDRSQDAAENAILAQQAFDSNDLPAARAAIGAAIASRDDVVEYHLLRGRIELGLGSPGAAFDAYRNALALDPTNGEGLLAVAQLGLTTGNLRESLDAAELVLTLAPNQMDALLIRGVHSIVKRDYSEAMEYGDKILAIAPGHAGATILKARALFMSGKHEEALATLDEISGDEAASQPAALTRLEMNRALRQPSGMMVEFERLRAVSRDDLALRIDEANFHFKLGDNRKGHELVAGVLADPKADARIANLAISLLQEYGAQEVSEATLERINRDGSVAAREALARFLVEQGRASDAERTLSTLPENVGEGLRARSILLSGDHARSGRLAAEILGREATDCDALVAASESALRRQAADDALRFAQQASAECPTMPSAWTATASAYQRLERDSGVNRTYVQSLEANKQNSQLTAAYTRWLVSVGRTREAVAMARRLTRYAPALVSGWRIYGDLCRRFDPRCVAEATRGMSNAQTLFAIDQPPGTPPPNGLFGRLTER